MKPRLTREQHIGLAKELHALHDQSCRNVVLLNNSYPHNSKVSRAAINLRIAVDRLRLALDEDQDIYFNSEVNR